MGIATIHVEAWRVAYRGIVPDEYLCALSIEKRHAGWRQILDAGESVRVAESGDKALGWISAARSRDVAGRLRRQGFTDVTLWVLKDNERALKFYLSTGLIRDACEDRIVQLGGQALPRGTHEKTFCLTNSPRNHAVKRNVLGLLVRWMHGESEGTP